MNHETCQMEFCWPLSKRYARVNSPGKLSWSLVSVGEASGLKAVEAGVDWRLGDVTQGCKKL